MQSSKTEHCMMGDVISPGHIMVFKEESNCKHTVELHGFYRVCRLLFQCLSHPLSSPLGRMIYHHPQPSVCFHDFLPHWGIISVQGERELKCHLQSIWSNSFQVPLREPQRVSSSYPPFVTLLQGGWNPGNGQHEGSMSLTESLCKVVVLGRNETVF